jgi:hypothetical protein
MPRSRSRRLWIRAAALVETGLGFRPERTGQYGGVLALVYLTLVFDLAQVDAIAE